MTADGVEDQRELRKRQLAELRRFEELFGGRVLAWVGGLATLLGMVFLVGIALEHGWIDESMRIVLGFLGSTSLLLAGFWLYERKGHTEAALAAVGSGLAGLYATLLVGTQVYDLIPSYLGLACAALVGIVGVAIAVRWKSMIVAAIGILGGLSAPALVGTGTTGVSVAFMAIALATAVGVLLWQRWNWLSPACGQRALPRSIRYTGACIGSCQTPANRVSWSCGETLRRFQKTCDRSFGSCFRRRHRARSLLPWTSWDLPSVSADSGTPTWLRMRSAGLWWRVDSPACYLPMSTP